MPIRGLKAGFFLLALLPGLLLVLRGAGLVSPGLGANPVETIQDTLGLWGLRLLLLTLCLSPLAWLTGRPWPLALRRMAGLFAFGYILLHFVAWALLDQALAWAAIIEDIVERPFITIGLVALLMLLPLAVTSTRGWQRRLGARRWQRLHMLIYPAAVLGCWHYFWQVKADIREPLFYSVLLAVLLLARLYRRRLARR